MAFIDYVTLLLVNMTAGHFILAWYLIRGFEEEDQRGWSVAFAVVGAVALLNGLDMVWNWPLPGPFNSAFGEMSVVLGALFLGAAFAVARKWDLTILGCYGFFAGLAAVVIGIQIIHLGLTQAPMLSGIGFVLSGSAGILACPTLLLKEIRPLRYLGTLMLVGAGLIWALTTYGAFWSHMEGFKDWTPATTEQSGR